MMLQKYFRRCPQQKPANLDTLHFAMIIDSAALNSALMSLLNAKGVECHDHTVEVSMLGPDDSAAAFLVSPTRACARRLAEELTRLTGRPMLYDHPEWVLLQSDAQRVVRDAQQRLSLPAD